MDSIRSLRRGIAVLRALDDCGVASLDALHRSTDLPKPTLKRILDTLIETGLITRRLADGNYRISSSGIAQKADRHQAVAEAAAPVLDRLCRKVLWPSDLMVPAGTHMERRETSQAYSPFFPQRSSRNQVGQRVNWLLTGVGRAYLAFCPQGERERIIYRLRGTGMPEDLLAHNPARLSRYLDETRARGYGLRDPGYVGGPYGDSPRDDGLSGMAVPLIGRRRVWGTINILWIRTAYSSDAFAQIHLADLQDAAREIVRSIEGAD